MHLFVTHPLLAYFCCLMPEAHWYSLTYPEVPQVFPQSTVWPQLLTALPHLPLHVASLDSAGHELQDLVDGLHPCAQICLMPSVCPHEFVHIKSPPWHTDPAWVVHAVQLLPEHPLFPQS